MERGLNHASKRMSAQVNWHHNTVTFVSVFHGAHKITDQERKATLVKSAERANEIHST